MEMTATPLTDDREDLERTLLAPHLPALDGLRAVAVGVVVAYHAGASKVPGDLGVSAFFVLSGFLITWLLLKEYRASGDVSLRRFYLRRVLRIFPAYYAFLAFSFALDFALGDRWRPQLAWSAVTYTVNYFNATHGHPGTSIAHAWSLAIEEQFYLLWPAIFLALVRGTATRARAVVVGLIAVVVAWRSVLYLVGHVESAYVYNAFDTRFDNLLVGCLLAFVLHGARGRALARTAARRAWYPLVPLVLLVVSRTATPPTYHYSLGFTVDAVLVALLIVQLLQLSAWRFWQWLDWPLVRWLGRISYPIYLYHIWGLALGAKVLRSPAWVTAPVGVLATIALATTSYVVIEQPFLALKRGFEPRRARDVELERSAA
jgi:peptidoglycan/LPS O-acetylase OafA/YrhL